MTEQRKIYKPDFLRHSKHHTAIGVKVLDQVWELISCSMVSGQMSFKNITERLNKDNVSQFGGRFDGTRWKDMGVTTDGRVHDMKATKSHAEYVETAVNSLRILGLKLRKDAFLTVEERLPVVSDGPNSYEVAIHTEPRGAGYMTSKVSFRPMETKKHYKLIHDPVRSSWSGDLLTTLEKVFELVDENVEVFADPFEIRNTSRNKDYANEVKTIRPGLRQQVRKMTGRQKRYATVINVVDEVKP